MTASVTDVVSLSFGQQAILLSQRSGTWGGMNVDVSVALGTDPDEGSVRHLLRRLQVRNDALRARLATRRGRVVMEFLDVAEVPPIEVSVGEMPYENDWAIRDFRAWSSAPFGRGSVPLAKALLAKRHGVTWLHLVVDPLVCDGWSIAVLTEEATAIWGSITRGDPETEPPGSFRDYLAEQAAHRSPEALEQYRSHWGAVLDHDVAVPMERREGEGFLRLNFVVPTAMSVGLPSLRERMRTTDFCLFASTIATLFARRSSVGSLVIYTHIAERHQAHTLSTVGYLVNYVGVRIDVGPTFEDTVRSCQVNLLEAMHQQVGPFFDLAARATGGGASIAIEPHGYAGEAWNAWGRDCRKPDSLQARMAVGDEVDWNVLRSAPTPIGDLAFHYKPASFGYILGLIFDLAFLDEAQARILASEFLGVLGEQMGDAGVGPDDVARLARTGTPGSGWLERVGLEPS